MFWSESVVELRNTTASLEGCVFEDNGTAGIQASGLWVDHEAVVTIRRSRFENNTCYGALFREPGALGSIQVVESQFIGNTTAVGGGGAAARVENTRFVSCLFQDNHSPQWHGGAIYGVLNRYENCLFVSNHAGDPGSGRSGGAVATSGCGVQDFFNCTFYGNTADGNPQAVSGCATLYNCIVQGTGDQVDSVSAAVHNSILSDPHPIGTNILLGDPLFADPDAPTTTCRPGGTTTSRCSRVRRQSTRATARTSRRT